MKIIVKSDGIKIRNDAKASISFLNIDPVAKPVNPPVKPSNEKIPPKMVRRRSRTVMFLVLSIERERRHFCLSIPKYVIPKVVLVLARHEPADVLPTDRLPL